MRRINTSFRPNAVSLRKMVLAALFLPLVVLGCSSDSPTEPTQNPQPAPGGGGLTSFNISVTASPTEVPADNATPVVITVSVRRADNGAPPADNTTLVVSTTAGNFTTPNIGPQSGSVSLVG